MTRRVVEMPEHELEQYRAGGYDEEVDFDYIRSSGREVAAALAHGRAIEIAYQPGDGTRYPLVFTPLWTVETASPREVDGVRWDSRACPGVTDGEAYPYGSVLVTRVERGASYPMRLHPRGGPFEGLAASYVAEHLDARGASAVSLTLLFREVAAGLRRLASVASV